MSHLFKLLAGALLVAGLFSSIANNPLKAMADPCSTCSPCHCTECHCGQ